MPPKLSRDYINEQPSSHIAQSSPHSVDSDFDTAGERSELKPRVVSPHNALQLQRMLGNRAVTQMIKNKQSGKPQVAVSSIQRLVVGKKGLAKTALDKAKGALSQDESDIDACMAWANELGDFEAFTASNAAFDIFVKLNALGAVPTAVEVREAAGNDSGELVSAAKGFITAASGKPLVEAEAPKAKKEKEPASKVPKNIPKELAFDAPSKAVGPVRPANGNSFADLALIDKSSFPSTFAATMFNIHSQNSTPMTIGAAKLLNGNKNTVKETVEVKVSMYDRDTSTNYFFVVHYHPKAAIPDGPLSGESDIHVKADQAAKYKHETMIESVLTAAGIPSLATIQAQFGATII